MYFISKKELSLGINNEQNLYNPFTSVCWTITVFAARPSFSNSFSKNLKTYLYIFKHILGYIFVRLTFYIAQKRNEKFTSVKRTLSMMIPHQHSSHSWNIWLRSNQNLLPLQTKHQDTNVTCQSSVKRKLFVYQLLIKILSPLFITINKNC